MRTSGSGVHQTRNALARNASLGGVVLRTGPSRADLLRMLAEAAANTASLAEDSAVVRSIPRWPKGHEHETGN